MYKRSIYQDRLGTKRPGHAENRSIFRRMGSMSARVGSVIAPFAVELWALVERAGGFNAPDGPLLLFGSAGIVAGIVGFLFLPETRGRVTPETVADMLLEEEELRQQKKSECCRCCCFPRLLSF